MFDIVGARGSEGTPGGHGNVRVGVGSLSAESLVFAVVRCMRLELRVHVPSKFLGSRLWVVELLLGLALERLQLGLQHLELLLGICAT